MQILFIDFVFYSGELVTSSGFSFWTFLNTIIGSFLGFLGALYLFRNTQSSTERREERNRQQAFVDKYNYFVFLVKDIPGLLDQQVGYYQSFIASIDQDKYKLHSIAYTVYTPLSRVVDSKDNESFFHAYVNQVDVATRPAKIEEFKTLYLLLDYYHQSIEQSEEKFEPTKNKIRTQIDKFNDELTEVENYAASLIKNTDMQRDHSPILRVINAIFQDYIPQKSEHQNDIPFHFNNFLNPMLELCVNTSGYNIELMHHLALLVKTARTTYTSIENYSSDQATVFSRYEKALLHNREKLTSIIATM